jgi:hypothetical protein
MRKGLKTEKNIYGKIKMEEDLDISWILEQERLEQINHNCWREDLKEIEIATIYINQNKEIEKIEREKMDVSGVKIITKERLIQITQSKKKYTPISKFILKETLWFHIDLEPENIQSFSEKQNTFLHIYPILEDIVLKPSIFIFHKLNTIFFFFYEIPIVKPMLNSIIKTNTTTHNKTKKKVEIIELQPSSLKTKTTRKKMT